MLHLGSLSTACPYVGPMSRAMSAGLKDERDGRCDHLRNRAIKACGTWERHTRTIDISIGFTPCSYGRKRADHTLGQMLYPLCGPLRSRTRLRSHQYTVTHLRLGIDHPNGAAI